MLNDIIKFGNENSGAISLLFSLVVTLSTVFYVLLTAKLVRETKLMRRAQTDPHVAVRIEPNESWQHIIMLIVENVGPGPAYNVRLSITPDFEMEQHELLSDIGIFKHGISYLASGHAIKTYLTMIMGKAEEIQQPNGKYNFTIAASYESATQQKFQQTYPINFLHLVGLSRIGRPHMQSIADDIEKIKDAIEKFRSGWSKLQVDVYTEEDRDNERKEIEEERKRIYAESEKQKSSPSPKTDSTTLS